MNRSKWNLVVLAGLLVGAAPFVARAQTATPAKSSGAIEGAVYNDGNGNDVFDLDESGVQGITLRLQGDGIERTAKTDEGGLYRFVGVPNGTYTVTVDPGDDYTASDRTDYEGLDVSGDTLASVDFALEADSASASATSATPTTEASATAPVTDTEAATAIAEPSATVTATVEVAAVVEPAATVAPSMSATTTMGAGMVPSGLAAMATAMAMYPTPAAGMPAQGMAGMAGMATAMPGMATAMPMGQPSQMVIAQPATTAGQMPQTGFEDLGGGTLLGAAVVVLLLLAGAGWAMERRA
jgi:hypothetical protein